MRRAPAPGGGRPGRLGVRSRRRRGAVEEQPIRKGASASHSFVAPGGGTISLARLAFRGTRREPTEWRLGIYAGRAADAPATQLVAGCDPKRCEGVEEHGAQFLSRRDGGVALPRDYDLPKGTRRIDIRAECVAAAGCTRRDREEETTLTPTRNVEANQAVLSVYSASLKLDVALAATKPSPSRLAPPEFRLVDRRLRVRRRRALVTLQCTGASRCAGTARLTGAAKAVELRAGAQRTVRIAVSRSTLRARRGGRAVAAALTLRIGDRTERHPITLRSA